jgi:hypothetical protein
VRCAIAVSLAAWSAVASAEEYVVREGDSCLGIVRALFPGDRGALARLHELNPELGPLPHRLVPGQRLRVDPSTAAEVTFVRPRVTTRRRAQGAWVAATEGLRLYRLDEVLTQPEAAAEITFRDATRLHLGGDALLVIQGAVAGLAEVRRAGTIELLHGDLRLHLAELRRDPRREVVVATPSARVATDARDLLVSVDRDTMSRVSVHAGRAEVAARRETVRVGVGQGTRVARGRPPEPPRPLPAAPAWHDPGTRDLVAAYAGAAAPVTLAWLPAARAARYRVVLARDPRHVDSVVDVEVAAPPAVSPPLLPGRYHARVVAIDADGLVGLPATRVVDVVAVEAVRGAVAAPGSLRGVGELLVALPGLADARVTLDGKPVKAPFVVRDVGRRQLSVEPRGGGVAIVATCEVVAPRAIVAFRGGEVELRLVDDAGRPLELDPGADLALVGRGGLSVGKLRRTGPGATFRARAAGRGAAVALWEGRPIGEARL